MTVTQAGGQKKAPTQAGAQAQASTRAHGRAQPDAGARAPGRTPTQTDAGARARGRTPTQAGAQAQEKTPQSPSASLVALLGNDGLIPTLTRCPLFRGINEADLATLLSCLGATRASVAKGGFVFRAGDAARKVGVVLSGDIHIMQEDFWGNRSILARIEPGELFAEAFSCSQIDTLPVSVVATRPSEVLLVDYKRIITTCSSACTFHASLIHNMLRILARNNIGLTQKMEHITQRSTREKLFSYLSAQAKQAGSNRFCIPFDRQELADYLSVDRSAMSSELGKMRDAGILRFEKNRFELL
ncbi:MAG: Crp/Fnr family transcriptional regulator [Coriobacteriales bacterium]|nr:Crp/Fnr family transcriptional regulator [Coriobacteriales bacterium]